MTDATMVVMCCLLLVLSLPAAFCVYSFVTWVVQLKEHCYSQDEKRQKCNSMSLHRRVQNIVGLISMVEKCGLMAEVHEA